MKRFLIFLVLFVLIGACSEHNEVTPTPGESVFTMIIDSNVNTTGSGDWLIIHDINGQLLYSKLFEAGDTIRYQPVDKPSSDKMNINLFHYTTSNTPQRSYKLNSYLQMPVGEVWKMSNPAGDTTWQYQTGTFKVTAEDVQADTQFSLSDKRGNAGLFTYAPAYTNTYVSETYLVTGSPDYLLTMRDPQDQIRYTFFENVKVGSNYTVSFLAMSIPETILPVSFPKSDAIFLTVNALEPDQPKSQEGYRLLGAYEFQTGRTKMNIAYLDKFQYYQTYFGIENSNGLYQYDKRGAKSEGISFPLESVFDITNRSLTNFAFTTNTNFIRRQSEWSNWIYKGDVLQTVIEWNVHSAADGEQKIKEFPPQFNTIYPDFKFDDLPYRSTTFYLSGASTFSDVMDSSFKGKVLTTEHETYAVKVY